MRKLFVLMAAVAFVVAFTLPAAGEVSISGDAEMNAWFDSASKEASVTGNYDDDDFNFSQDGNSKITFDFKNGAVGGKVEIRYDGSAVTDRHWYGTYTTGLGTWVFGQTGPPTDVVAGVPKRGFGSGSGNNDASRQPGIQLWTGGLKVALFPPNVGDSIIPVRSDTDTTIPAIEASYDLTAGPVGVTLFAGYNTYDEVNATDQSYSVDSTCYGGKVKFAAGPLGIEATLYAATNPNEGLHWGEFDAAWDGTAIQDASIMGYNAVVTYKVSDTLSFNGSYGYDESELDLPGTWENDESTYYVNAIITLAEGVSIAPEYGKVDHGDLITPAGTTKTGDESWFGAEFKIKF